MDNFKQITLSKKPKEASELQLIFYPAIVLVTLTILLTLIYQPLAYLGILITIVHFIFRENIRTLYPDWVKISEICGSILFDKNFIKLNDGQKQKIELETVKQIDFHHNYIQGEKMGNRDIVHNGLVSLKITNKSEQTVTCRFLIENQPQFKSLQIILKEWYKQKITIKETFGNYQQKTILLNLNLDYNTIQELKTELEVESFY